MTNEQKLRKVIRSLIKEELKNLKYDEPSLHKNEDAPYGKPDPSKYLSPEGVDPKLKDNKLNQLKADFKKLTGKELKDIVKFRPNSSSKILKVVQTLNKKYGNILRGRTPLSISGENDVEFETDFFDLDETSSVSAMGGGDSFQTPFAFSKPGSDPNKKRALKNNKWAVVGTEKI